MRTGSLKYERIRDLRIDQGLTQTQIAEVLHIKQNTYSQYEIGILNYPLDVVIQLAIFYNTSVDYLVGLTDDPTPYKRRKR
ncbi:helix-turn-helix domain-containing protein [Solibaculum mannosilyticum]|uniref:Transcriptional regulator n=1 Tax=Solibaculum mannosilyticum TaxID=2780922 RepID=A0A7I8D2A2_9FIRM|nr:helix-turn-helix transcriptional regulator [Solibaculum mannosilyticum]MCO7137392.1 helix-turn-helix domain-containing protein [[Clostridium] leptum]BCI59559.1 transcriptional regulator [Solibaculum mannosilyticum]CZT55340.1 Helix-turn-helix domain protein [Eubacteriaceae bacterium CHKCI005]